MRLGTPTLVTNASRTVVIESIASSIAHPPVDEPAPARAYPFFSSSSATTSTPDARPGAASAIGSNAGPSAAMGSMARSPWL